MLGRTPFNFSLAAGGVGVESNHLLTTLIAAPVSINPSNFLLSTVSGSSRKSLAKLFIGCLAVFAAATESGAAKFSFPRQLILEEHTGCWIYDHFLSPVGAAAVADFSGKPRIYSIQKEDVPVSDSQNRHVSSFPEELDLFLA